LSARYEKAGRGELIVRAPSRLREGGRPSGEGWHNRVCAITVALLRGQLEAYVCGTTERLARTPQFNDLLGNQSDRSLDRPILVLIANDELIPGTSIVTS
jgi:hypothetical protein